MKVPGVVNAIGSKDLPFPIDEFQQRLAKVRKEMAARDLDIFVTHTPENIYYLSGFRTPGYYAYQCLIIPASGSPVHITRGTEETNVKQFSWIDRSTSYMDHEDPVELTTRTLQEEGLARGRMGIEKNSWFLTVANFERLQAMLPSVHIEDASGIVELGRLIKSDREIEYIRRAARVAEVGMKAGLETIRVGATEDDVAAEIQKATTLMGSEYPSLPVFVRSGVRTSYTHATWSGRRLEKGDPLLIELSGCVNRYSAALYRGAVIGPPTPLLQRMSDVSVRAIEKHFAAIQPGRPLEEVWEAWAEAMEKGGFEGRFKRAGYSIGINFPPDWGEGHILSFRRGEKRLLEPNMTFHVTSVVKQYGTADMATSETILITDTGVEVLTNFDRGISVR